MEIKTERLKLRLLSKRDVHDIYELCSDPFASRYSDWHPHNNIWQSQRYIQHTLNNARQKKFLTFGIELKIAKKLIGTCSFTEFNYNSTIAQIGYSLSKAYCGKGYATEAVNAFVDYGLNVLNLQRIEAKVLCENTASIKLLERVGFQKEGLLKRGAFCKTRCVDIYLYGIISSKGNNL